MLIKKDRQLASLLQVAKEQKILHEKIENVSLLIITCIKLINAEATINHRHQ